VCTSLSNKPVKLITSVWWPPVAGGHTFMEAPNSYNIMHGHYSLHKLVTCVPRNLAYSFTISTMLYVQVQLPVFADPQSCLDSVSYRPWAEILTNRTTCCNSVGRNSSVGIATRYGMGGPGIESRWGRDFLHPSRPALGPTQPPTQWIPGLSGE
jgi:hypothetical protein